MDVRQKVILREEKEESEHKHISKAIYKLKKNAQSNEEESAKRGSLIDCVYDKVKQLNVSDRGDAEPT